MLLPEVVKYINHKLKLAQVSTYYRRPGLQQSLQWAYNFKNYLRFQANGNEKYIAQNLLACQSHLKNLLPAEANKSYRSSLDNYNKILNTCKQLLGK